MARKKTTKRKTKVVTEKDLAVEIHPAVSAAASGKPVGEVLKLPKEVAVLAVRNTVLFPGTVMPLSIGREKSKKLVEDLLPEQKIIVTVCQKDPTQEDPETGDLYQVGTAAIILKLLRMDEGGLNLIVHGVCRVKIKKWTKEKPYLNAKISVIEDESRASDQMEALEMNVRNLAGRVIELSPNIPDEASMVLNNVEKTGPLSDFLAANLPMGTIERQKLLEEPRVRLRLKIVNLILQKQVDILELSHKISSKVRQNIDKTQRNYFLRQQLKEIQKELGELDEKTAEIEELREKIEKASMPESVKKEAVRELNRLEKIPSVSPEYNISRTYLDWMVELPWNVFTEDNLNIRRAKRILNEDHYGLDKIKKRILEYLAVRKLAPESRGPILCFVGPPGVGKTSLGQSIARALGRKFIRMSLGGMRDEAELRGHRKTYIGSMPGRIIQEIRKAGTHNPVFMLDELDKVGSDFRGDPASALLEILDPAQNFSFQDHYLNVPFDLSKVMFIATANYMGTVPPALRDRMEIIELPGYTAIEKLNIAQKYLVKRQMKENGLKSSWVNFTDAGIKKIIDSYTREAGVRELERQIGTVCRSIAAEIAAGKKKKYNASSKFAQQKLGPAIYESELAMRTTTPGVVTGLAYTPAGGEILFIEATSFPGKGELQLTGQIGDVMKESAQTAWSLVKSKAEKFNLDVEMLSKRNIHIHVPAGAVPKDGPSAGLAIATALVSLLSGKPTKPEIAMTGEITLRGLALPIGGVKQKVLAAKRAGIKQIILPERNKKDMIDIPPEAKKALEFSFVKKIDDVLEIALKPKVKGKK